MRVSTYLLAMCVANALSLAANATDLNLAVSAPRGQLDINKWNALSAYFSAETGAKISVSGIPPLRMDKEMETGHIALAVMNPVSAVTATHKRHATALATMKVNGMAQFAGAIITRTGNNINSIKDLKGKSAIAFQPSSAGAYVFQMYYLQSMGLDPRRDFSSLRQATRQDDIVFAVQKGLVDVGFVRSGILEAMAQEGKIKLADFQVIDSKTDNLKQLHSTPLYPEWFLVASNNLDAKLVAKIKAAALKLDAQHPAAREAQIDGFIEPLSLDGLRDALEALKLPPFGA